MNYTLFIDVHSTETEEVFVSAFFAIETTKLIIFKEAAPFSEQKVNYFSNIELKVYFPNNITYP